LVAAITVSVGYVQFIRSGFTYSVRAQMNPAQKLIALSVVNKGRSSGYVADVDVLRRPNLWRRLTLRLRRQGGAFPVLRGEIRPYRAESKNVTVLSSAATGSVGVDLPPGQMFTALLGPKDPKDNADEWSKRRKMLVAVRFADGRQARRIPTEDQYVRKADAPTGS
jgi:hypothetical protein